MTLSGYTEDALVEQPAIEIFKERGWDLGLRNKRTFGRQTNSDVVRHSRLRTTEEKLNSKLPQRRARGAVEDVVRDRSGDESRGGQLVSLTCCGTASEIRRGFCTVRVLKTTARHR